MFGSASYLPRPLASSARRSCRRLIRFARVAGLHRREPRDGRAIAWAIRSRPPIGQAARAAFDDGCRRPGASRAAWRTSNHFLNVLVSVPARRPLPSTCWREAYGPRSPSRSVLARDGPSCTAPAPAKVLPWQKNKKKKSLGDGEARKLLGGQKLAAISRIPSRSGRPGPLSPPLPRCGDKGFIHGHEEKYSRRLSVGAPHSRLVRCIVGAALAWAFPKYLDSGLTCRASEHAVTALPSASRASWSRAAMLLTGTRGCVSGEYI